MVTQMTLRSRGVKRGRRRLARELDKYPEMLPSAFTPSIQAGGDDCMGGKSSEATKRTPPVHPT